VRDRSSSRDPRVPRVTIRRPQVSTPGGTGAATTLGMLKAISLASLSTVTGGNSSWAQIQASAQPPQHRRR
jgi:hypothetical protein